MTEIITQPVEVIKPWQSKTIVLNAIFGALAIYRLISPGIANNFEAVLASNGPLIDSIWAGLNVALRFLTKDKVKLKESTG